METNNFLCYRMVINSFKSYYVVWKRKKKKIGDTYDKVFKSYYVVWKLVVGKIFIAITNRFKSYYVVWKHQNGSSNRR